MTNESSPIYVTPTSAMNEKNQADDMYRAPVVRKDLHEEKALEKISVEFAHFLDCSPVPTFVLDLNHVITHWNKACEHVLGFSSDFMLETKKQWMPFYRTQRPVLADLMLHNKVEEDVFGLFNDKIKPSFLAKGACEVDAYFENLGESGLWLHFTAAPLLNKQGDIIGAIQTLEDITERKEAEKSLRLAHSDLEILVKKRTAQLAEANIQLELDISEREKIESELIRRNNDLTELNSQLFKAQEQLVQSEKLASIGQLAAGVAHEINNPIGYIFSNFTTLENYISQLFEMIHAYENVEQHITAASVIAEIKDIKEKIELEYLKEDIPELMLQSKEGIGRVRKIVQDLKDFSRIDSNQEWQWSNLHEGMNSTLNIVNNEIKYKADVIKEFGDIPDVECLPSQINQVIMNLVMNATHAIGAERGRIVIRTSRENDNAKIVVEDNGSGIPKDILSKIFDPFFTTKPIGKGTGLGLSLSYGIIQKHNGHIEVVSELGKGTSFIITLPIKHDYAESDDEGQANEP
ncbi:ATP-binding protein [Solimicrobium silvestre]|uniref:histidine kinase n=1 Tax=Solimicrobium silvestre TaxID=2099400 RepID=A0A2S9H057_9BURK|nr:ATP-binding protein [Solimicrobium silvestre]PRC93361.1 Histidine kinase-, DNA gyrase B-, and HSP90-like ATPase [Solimicrobium silvestre]